MYSTVCDGHDWQVNLCGSGEKVVADDWDCKCSFQVVNYSIFPCPNKLMLPQWGGINDHPCGGETQTIELRCDP